MSYVCQPCREINEIAFPNKFYNHAHMVLQKAASDAIWQRLQAAKQELERKEKEEDKKAPLSLLSGTLPVTPNQGVPLSA